MKPMSEEISMAKQTTKKDSKTTSTAAATKRVIPVAKAKNVTETATFRVEIEETQYQEVRNPTGTVEEIYNKQIRDVFVSVPLEKAAAFDVQKEYPSIWDAVIAQYAIPSMVKINIISVTRMQDTPSLFIS